MVQINAGWQLEITPRRQIFVSHLGTPRFKVEITIRGTVPQIDFSFKGQWEDKADDAMHWYMKALEFYQFAMKQQEMQQPELSAN
ncbi:hypothetical protein Cflav_PD1094 [Pedosphaera parvula Ellin514]|uniref:Uncharacterized protein n=2 Tax=Pedosphaera TaxID=1032526 RepID=B9XP05_PEDPL|nr:hypothetical protein Cflav_PD1094 [Pedosphaera parvula Ellin514]